MVANRMAERPWANPSSAAGSLPQGGVSIVWGHHHAKDRDAACCVNSQEAGLARMGPAELWSPGAGERFPGLWGFFDDHVRQL